MTALGNDVGFELVFSRQLIAHGRPHDIAMGFSTSGNSDNLMRAFAEARKQGMLTVGIAGTDGGRMAAEGSPVEQCFVVRSDSVHRIQESQAALNNALWAAVQDALIATRRRLVDRRRPGGPDRPNRARQAGFRPICSGDRQVQSASSHR